MELFPPQVLRGGPPLSAQLNTRVVYFALIFPSCSVSVLVGTEARPLLSARTQPRYPEARALRVLRRQSSRQLPSQPSLKANRPGPAAQSGVWRPLWATEQSGQHRAHRPQRPHPEPALPCTPRLETRTETSRVSPDASQHKAKEQLKTLWNAAIERNAFESVLMKWMKAS